MTVNSSEAAAPERDEGLRWLRPAEDPDRLCRCIADRQGFKLGYRSSTDYATRRSIAKVFDQSDARRDRTRPEPDVWLSQADGGYFLHAQHLKFQHPITGEQIHLEAALPTGF